MKLLFLLSLPRSGSTLLQRLLMGHTDISSCGEPWLALPISMMNNQSESFSTYGHFSQVRAVENLFENLDGGRDEFLKQGGQFMQNVYENLNDQDSLYFLDKTPRYYKIIDDLKVMFPEAKFIFLTREPIAVFGSILNYIEGAMYRLPTWEQDIVEGIPCLSAGIEASGGTGLHVSYESLVMDPESELKRILSYLELEMQPEMLDSLADREINMGDPFGAKKYKSVSQSSLESWKLAINSKTKKRVARKWLEAVPSACFNTFGTSKEEQLEKLDRHQVGFSACDICSWMVGATYFYNNLNVLRWSLRRRKMKMCRSLY
jgi:hypothetical protein